MKLNFTKEQHAEFIKHHFQIITAMTLDENNEIYYIVPAKENYTKDDQLIAKLQAEKFGFKVNDSYMVEDYNPENKTFCANYERDNYPLEPNSANSNKNTNTTSPVNYVYDLIVINSAETCDDPVVEAVREKLLSRSKIGYNKYKTTLKDNTKDNYLEHAQMEAMDLANYLECLIQQKKDITQIVKQYLNDQELGKVIRSIYGKK